VSEEYGTLRVRVGEEIVEFVGRELIHAPGERNERTNEPHGQDFTLYETPDEGRQLHVQEWRIKGNTERKTLETAAEIERIGALYSEEDAKKTYPKVLEELLRLAKN
jgi:hypothetical protein